MKVPQAIPKKGIFQKTAPRKLNKPSYRVNYIGEEIFSKFEL